MQGFTAAVVWLDEMPNDASLVTELMLRVSTNDGIFMATFTPLVENEAVKRIVDSKAPGKRKYMFKVDDNPALDAKALEEYLLKLKASASTDAEYRARRYGEWYYRTGRVIRAYNPDINKVPLPTDYDKIWRHVSVVDPAASGLVGLTVWAEQPDTLKWYNVVAKKIQGDAAFLLVPLVEKELYGMNIVKRICDCNPAGFYKEASRQGIKYHHVSDKVDRKNDTIDAVNTSFVEIRILLTEEHSALLEEECLSCKWSESDSNKIIHSSKWHLIDTMRYFVDKIPPIDKLQIVYDNERHAAKQLNIKQKETKVVQDNKIRMKIIRRRNKFKTRRMR